MHPTLRYPLSLSFSLPIYLSIYLSLPFPLLLQLPHHCSINVLWSVQEYMLQILGLGCSFFYVLFLFTLMLLGHPDEPFITITYRGKRGMFFNIMYYALRLFTYMFLSLFLFLSSNSNWIFCFLPLPHLVEKLFRVLYFSGYSLSYSYNTTFSSDIIN